jgi:hypothetical protein
MGGKVKKGAPAEVIRRVHDRRELPDNLLRFSFRHLADDDEFGAAHADAPSEYLGTLLERLKAVSGMTLSEFRSNRDKALRAHTHSWSETSRSNGYAHLTQQLQDCEPWQFCLTANEHGRVHGLLIDEVFYIVWLDPTHALYPGS